MAVHAKGVRGEEEEETTFVSMTDLMISILFIFMILMAFFAYHQSKDETVPKKKYDEQVALVEVLEKEVKSQKEEIERLRKIIEDLQKTKQDIFAKELQNIAKAREIILSNIKEKLLISGIKVKIDHVSGILRFDEKSIKFLPGKFEPEDFVRDRMIKISEILREELKCYTLGSSSKIEENCNPNLSIVEALQIEGHTDNVPMRGVYGIKNNLDLSAKRAAETYGVIVAANEALKSYQNANYIFNNLISNNANVYGEPVLSISGYGETRPLNGNSTIEEKSANRRIDLRFIMTTPKSLPEVYRLKESIQKAMNVIGSN